MNEERLQSLLLAWQEQQAQGRDVPAAELCRDCPELAGELARRIEVVRQMNALPRAGAASTRPAGTPAAADSTGNAPSNVNSDDRATLIVGSPPAAWPPSATQPESVPGYEILGELGRGGMGVVYQARHVQLNRFVALKMIKAGSRAGPEEL